MDRYFATSDDVTTDPDISELDNPEVEHKPKLLFGARIVFTCGTPDILVYPRDRAAYGRLCQLLTLFTAGLGRISTLQDAIITQPDLDAPTASRGTSGGTELSETQLISTHPVLRHRY